MAELIYVLYHANFVTHNIKFDSIINNPKNKKEKIQKKKKKIEQSRAQTKEQTCDLRKKIHLKRGVGA